MKRNFRTFALFFILMLLLSGCAAGGADKEMSNGFNPNDQYLDDGWNEKPSVESETSKDNHSDLTENDLTNRKLIKTVYLTLQTKEFDRLKTMLDELIPAYGGYVQDSNYYAPQREGRYRNYSLTVRIPVDNLEVFIDKVGLLGTLTNKSEKVEDVTLTYIDMTAYKEALEVEYDKILELLEQAKDLDQILILESKLSELRYEINSYESKLRAYDNLVSYSTIHIDISEVEYETVVKDTIGSRISAGFMQSLHDVRDFFVDLIVFLVGNLPVLLVLALFFVLLVFLLRKFTRRGRKKRELKKQAKSNYLNQSNITSSDDDNSIE